MSRDQSLVDTLVLQQRNQMPNLNHSAWKRYVITAVLAVWVVVTTVAQIVPATVYKNSGYWVAELYQAAKGVHQNYHWYSPSLLLHFLFFGVTMVLAVAVLVTYQRLTVSLLLVVAGSITVCGLILELLQQFFITGRAFEQQDLMANVGGTSLALIVGLLLVAWRRLI